MSKVLVLSDGGFKSAFVTGLAVKENGHENVKLLFMDGGQLAALRQREAVVSQADHYEIPYTVFQMSMATQGLFELTTYIFTALSYASQCGFDKVMYGASKITNKEDRLGDYEHTHTHLRNMQLMMKSARLENRHATLPEPEAPCMLLRTDQIIMLSRHYNVPLQLTWNCEFSLPQHCGKCAKCLRWQVATQRFLTTKYARVHTISGN